MRMVKELFSVSTPERMDFRENDTVQRPYFVMELRLLPWQELLISLAMMLVLILIVVHFNVPNPNMILISGLVVSSALFGYNGGLLSAALMLLYSMYFFSTDHNFVSYTVMNLEKLIVILIGIVVVLLFVCELKRSSLRAFHEIEKLSEELKEDNLLLKEISMNDPLTGIRNRLALRRDFTGYIGANVFVMMMDVDNFKEINDCHGHDQGDRILRMTGRNLSEQFGQGHCYRYGGDEFLVIFPDGGETDFRGRLRNIFDLSPAIDRNRADGERASYSAGYVSGTVEEESDLRAMISAADEHMYTAKRSGKNKIEGSVMPAAR